METAILSVRLPKQTIQELKAYCKQNNTNPSNFVRKKFTDIGQESIFGNGGEIENDIADTLIGLAGGGTVGILVYKAIKAKLQEHKSEEYTSEKIETLSVVGGSAAALLAGYGITKLIQALSK